MALSDEHKAAEVAYDSDSDSDDDDDLIIADAAFAYQVLFLNHQFCGDNMEEKGRIGDIVLHLQLQHILQLTKIVTSDARIVRVGYIYDDNDPHHFPLKKRVLSIPFPPSLLHDAQTLKAYILSKLPDFGGIISITIDISSLLNCASKLYYDHNNQHSNLIIWGELNLFKERIYEEKYVLKKEYVFDYEDHDLNCAICLNGLAGGIECSRTECSHIFHKSCIFPWMVEHNTCPMCRELIAPYF